MKYPTYAELFEAIRKSVETVCKAAPGGKAVNVNVRMMPGISTAAVARLGGLNFELLLPVAPLDKRLKPHQAARFTGLWLHELAHIVYTDFDAWDQANKENLARVVNCLEDVRIEAASLRDAWSENFFPALENTINELIPDKYNPANDKGFALAIYGRQDQCGYTLEGVPGLDTLGPNLGAFIRDTLAQLRQCHDTWDVLDLARKLRMPEPDQGDQGQGKGQGNQGGQEGDQESAQGDQGQPGDQEGDQEGQGSPGEAQKPEGDQGDQEGQGGQETGQGNQEGDQGEGQADQEGNQGPGVGKGGQGAGLTDDQIGDSEPHVGDLLEELFKGENFGHEDFAQVKGMIEAYEMEPAVFQKVDRHSTTWAPVGFKRLPSPTPSVAHFTKLSRSVERTAKLRESIRKICAGPERFKKTRRETSGRLHARHLVRGFLGAENIYKRKEWKPSERTAVSVLLDLSGSMDNATHTGKLNRYGKPERVKRITQGKALLCAMAEALDKSGSPYEIGGFTDASYEPTYSCAKTFEGKLDAVARYSMASMYPSGGTDYCRSMKLCAKRLLAQDVKHRVMIVLTDGRDGYSTDTIKGMVREVTNQGITVIGIGIGPGADVAAYFPISETIMDLAQLARQGLEGIVKQLPRPQE